MPSDYRKHVLEQTRREVGDKIFEILWTNKLPAVIDLEEKIYKVSSEYYPFEKPDEILEYLITITAVKYRDVVIANQPDFYYGFSEPTVKDLLRKWKKNLVSRWSNWRSRSPL